MLKHRNSRLLVMLIAGLAVVAAVYFFQQKDNAAIVDPSLFRVADLAKIDGVVMESPAGKINLHYENPGWKVNDRFEADRQLITVLFATLEQVVPRRPLPANQSDSVAMRLSKSGVTVSLYEGQVLKKQFLSGGNPGKNEAYFKLSDDRNVYIVAIPGYRVDVSRIFQLDENGWRDKRIFNFNWRNFKSLSSTFSGEPGADFSIGMKDQIFTIPDMSDPDTSRINTYLDDLSLLLCDRIISQGDLKPYDSVAKTPPANTIVITDIAQRTFRLDLFHSPNHETLILGKTGEGDMVLFERNKFSRVFKKRPYFKLKKGS